MKSVFSISLIRGGGSVFLSSPVRWSNRLILKSKRVQFVSSEIKMLAFGNCLHLRVLFQGILGNHLDGDPILHVVGVNQILWKNVKMELKT